MKHLREHVPCLGATFAPVFPWFLKKRFKTFSTDRKIDIFKKNQYFYFPSFFLSLSSIECLYLRGGIFARTVATSISFGHFCVNLFMAIAFMYYLPSFESKMVAEFMSILRSLRLRANGIHDRRHGHDHRSRSSYLLHMGGAIKILHQHIRADT